MLAFVFSFSGMEQVVPDAGPKGVLAVVNQGMIVWLAAIAGLQDKHHQWSYLGHSAGRSQPLVLARTKRCLITNGAAAAAASAVSVPRGRCRAGSR